MRIVPAQAFQPHSVLPARPLSAGAPGESFSSAPAEPLGVMKPTRFPSEARPLWKDVERLGLWASCQAVTSPLTAAMSAEGVADFASLLGDFERAGFRFSAISDPNQPRTYGTTEFSPASVQRGLLESDWPEGTFGRLTLSQPLANPPEEGLFERVDRDAIKQVKVHSFQDLKDAESIFLARDFDRLENPALARRLDRLEQAGVRFRILEAEGREGYAVGEALKNGSSRPVGVYGAYRALVRDGKDAPWLWGAGKGLHPTQSVADLEKLEFFHLGASVPELDKDPLAQRLRDLASIGLTFHRGDDHEGVDAASAFHALREQRYYRLGVSLQGAARENLELRDGEVPTPTRRLLAMAEFHHRVIASDASLTAEEKRFYAHGLSWASEAHPLEESLATIHQMRDFEDGLQPGRSAEQRTRMGVASYGLLMRALGEGQKPADLVGEFQELRRRGVRPEVASKALVHFREKLRPQVFSQAEYLEERERLLELSELAGSFDEAAEARKVLKMEIAEPYPERLAALKTLAGAEARRSGRASGVKEALLDYRTLLGSPRAGLESAAQLLAALHDALVPRLGHEGSREMYDYLQRGITHGAFGPEAVGVFAREFDLAKDVEFARGFLKAQPAITEPYEVRQRAAGTLREAMKGLEPPAREELDLSDPFSTKPARPGRDRPSEEYRFLLGFENRSLERDAHALGNLYRLIVPGGSSFEQGRSIFGQLKAGLLGPEEGFVERFAAELELSGQPELARRGLAGDYPGTLAERQALRAGVADGADFNAVLAQHRAGERLEDELECLALVHRALLPGVTPEQSRAAFGELMTSLREGPWSGRPLKEATAEFVRSYALKNDLKHALDSLQLAPEGKGGVQEGERQVIIGGVRIRRR